MKPLDPRLLRYAKDTRRYIALIAATGIASALLVVAQAITIAHTISPVITRQAPITQVTTALTIFIAVSALRVVVAYLQNAWSQRAATTAIRQLRGKVIDHAAQLGPRWRAQHGADTATLLTRGLDDLGPYFTAYLPQLILTVTVTPLTIAIMLYLDWISALFAIITIPLIPIFMILVGKLTAEYSAQRLRTMERLGSQLLDLIAGLPTLKALGKEHTPIPHVRQLGQLHARTTMQTLRVAFLSGAILEFLATLSVALVAVEVGLRLVNAKIGLIAALATIMLAPEVYKPLREVGKHFHASADGLAAAEAAFKILETKAPTSGHQNSPNLREANVDLQALNIAARGAWAPHNLTAHIEPGTICALQGPSGAGKTTTMLALLKLIDPTTGTITISPTHTNQHLKLSDIDPRSWWKQVTWVPQTPVIVPASVLDNVTGRALTTGGQTNPTEHTPTDQYDTTTKITPQIQTAAELTGFNQIVTQLPHGWNTHIGQGGIGLSVGQRQRLALTKALLSDTPWVLLDEPTAHLDAISEKQIINVLHALKKQGRTVIVIAHRSAVTRCADQIINVHNSPANADDLNHYPQLQAASYEEISLISSPRLLEGDPA